MQMPSLSTMCPVVPGFRSETLSLQHIRVPECIIVSITRVLLVKVALPLRFYANPQLPAVKIIVKSAIPMHYAHFVCGPVSMHDTPIVPKPNLFRE